MFVEYVWLTVLIPLLCFVIVGALGTRIRHGGGLITVAGDIDQPLATAPMAVRMRTLRLTVEGTATTGTLLLPTTLYLVSHAKSQRR